MNLIPQRIACLSAEAADWLWRVGAWENVLGVTAYFTQPDGVQPKPRVSGFSSANINEVIKLNPDLIITFSDVQAQLSAEFIQRGFPVLATNQRTLAEIEMTLALLARLVDREREGEKLLKEFRVRLAPVENVVRRPRVYFEEWNDPLLSGIAWVSELVQRMGGQDIFPELLTKRAAPQRMISAEQVLQANPEIIFASWCGKPVESVQIAGRPGWGELAAVRGENIFEIASEDILQPGFRLVYGYERMRGLLAGTGFTQV